jgi:hypothetical protein
MLKTYYRLLVEQGGAPGVYEERATGEWDWMEGSLAGLRAAGEPAPDIGVGDASDGVAEGVGEEAGEYASDDTSTSDSDSDSEEEY